MKTVELFCGHKSFSTVMARHGHETFTVDMDGSFNPSVISDILRLPIAALPYDIDILWASPPCTHFSVASIGANWTRRDRVHIPKNDGAREAQEIVKTTLRLIRGVAPTWYFIENPRCVLRKMRFMDGLFRHTITYCQYGDTRMKPTDVWTNAWWWHPKRICQNGDDCHEAAPRGARTGTQGIDGSKERSRIPSALFEEILRQMPN